MEKRRLPPEASRGEVSIPFPPSHLGRVARALPSWLLWRWERKVRGTQCEGMLSQSSRSHAPIRPGCQGSSQEYMLHNVSSTLRTTRYLLFRTHRSIVGIPLWLRGQRVLPKFTQLRNAAGTGSQAVGFLSSHRPTSQNSPERPWPRSPNPTFLPCLQEAELASPDNMV